MANLSRARLHPHDVVHAIAVVPERDHVPVRRHARQKGRPELRQGGAGELPQGVHATRVPPQYVPNRIGLRKLEVIQRARRRVVRLVRALYIHRVHGRAEWQQSEQVAGVRVVVRAVAERVLPGRRVNLTDVLAAVTAANT